VPGLQVRTPDGTWADVPYVPGSFAVNSGDMMMRWTNHRFKSTPHRAAPGWDRVARLIRYPPITYAAYLEWWYDANYNAGRQRDVA
jgi:hypothetical protein